MQKWLERNFSDNVQAQKTIATWASVFGAVGAVMFAIAFWLLKHPG